MASYTPLIEEDLLPRRPKEVVVSKKQLGERLRALRGEMTQVQLAELLGTYAANISSIEHGTRGVTIHQIAKLAKALKVSADELLGLDRRVAPRGRPRGGALASRLAQLAALPRSKQRAVIEMLDAYLEKHAIPGANGHGRLQPEADGRASSRPPAPGRARG